MTARAVAEAVCRWNAGLSGLSSADRLALVSAGLITWGGRGWVRTARGAMGGLLA